MSSRHQQQEDRLLQDSSDEENGTDGTQPTMMAATAQSPPQQQSQYPSASSSSSFYPAPRPHRYATSLSRDDDSHLHSHNNSLPPITQHSSSILIVRSRSNNASPTPLHSNGTSAGGGGAIYTSSVRAGSLGTSSYHRASTPTRQHQEIGLASSYSPHQPQYLHSPSSPQRTSHISMIARPVSVPIDALLMKPRSPVLANYPLDSSLDTSVLLPSDSSAKRGRQATQLDTRPRATTAAAALITTVAVTPATPSSAAVPSPRAELGMIFRLAYPVALATFFRIAMAVTDVAMLGHASTDWLAASAAASIWMNITTAILYRAFGGAIGTLCSQSYGAGNFRLVGIWLQQGLFFASLACAFVALTWWWTADILHLFGIDSKIAELGGTYTRWSLLWLLPVVWHECLQRYFQAHEIIFPALVVNAVFVCVNALLNLLLIFGIPAGVWPSAFGHSLHTNGWSGLGFIGSPIATTIARWGMFLSYWLYTCIYRRYHQRTFQKWCLNRKEALHPARIKQFLILQALPGAIGICLEEWQLEIVAIFATHLGSASIATHNATLEIFYFLTSFMIGLVIAVQVRVGSYLGAGNPVAAKQVGLIGLKISFGTGLVIGMLFIALRSEIGRIYSNDPEIWKLTKEISILVGCSYTLLSIFYTGMSILNGQARPMIVAVAYLLGCWCVCIPASYLLAFTADLGLIGLWYGLCLGYGIVTIIVGWKAYTSNWEVCAAEARERAEMKKKAAVTANVGVNGTTADEKKSNKKKKSRKRGKRRNTTDDRTTSAITTTTVNSIATTSKRVSSYKHSLNGTTQSDLIEPLNSGRSSINGGHDASLPNSTRSSYSDEEDGDATGVARVRGSRSPHSEFEYVTDSELLDYSDISESDSDNGEDADSHSHSASPSDSGVDEDAWNAEELAYKKQLQKEAARQQKLKLKEQQQQQQTPQQSPSRKRAASAVSYQEADRAAHAKVSINNKEIQPTRLFTSFNNNNQQQASSSSSSSNQPAPPLHEHANEHELEHEHEPLPDGEQGGIPLKEQSFETSARSSAAATPMETAIEIDAEAETHENQV